LIRFHCPQAASGKLKMGAAELQLKLKMQWVGKVRGVEKVAARLAKSEGYSTQGARLVVRFDLSIAEDKGIM